MFYLYRYFLLAAIAASLSLNALAQRSYKSLADSTKSLKIPTVTVTSTRAENRKSPTPYSEILGAELQEKNTAFDLPTLLASLPSTYVVSENGNGIGYTNFRLRGFDQRRIAVMINGVPQNDPEDHNVYWINFPDLASNLQSVQVQRGAGLMNYGSAALAGSVNLVTDAYAGNRFISISSGIGMQEFGVGNGSIMPTVSKFSIEASSGLTDNFSFYGRLTRINSSGYRDNSWSELNSYFFSVARISDFHSLQANVYGGPIADGLAYVGLPKQHVYNLALRRKNYSYWEYNPDDLQTGAESVGYAAETRPQEIENFSQPHYEILSDITLSENISLKSTLFYYTGDGFFDFDGSWADASTLRLTPEFGFSPGVQPSNSIIRSFVGNRHGGIVPRLAWNHEEGELTIGAEYRLHRSEHWGKIQFSGGLPSDFNPDYKFYEYNGGRGIMSIFAREQYRIHDAATINIEGQIVRHTYSIFDEKAGGKSVSFMQQNGLLSASELFTVHYLFFNPRLGINWNIDAEKNVFLSVALTSREPTMNNLYRASESYSGRTPLFAQNQAGEYDFSTPLTKPERMLDIEIGGVWTSREFRLAATAYWMEFSNELVKSGQLNIFGAPVDGNAPRTRHVGLELEGAYTFRLSSKFGSVVIGSNATVSRNRFIEFSTFGFTDVNGKEVQTELNLNGNRIAGFPDFMATLFVNYRVGELTTKISLHHVGEMKTDNYDDKLQQYYPFATNNIQYLDNRLPSYSFVNIEAGYMINKIASLESLRLKIQCNNATNLLYAAGGEGGQFFPAAERNFYFGVEVGM